MISFLWLSVWSVWFYINLIYPAESFAHFDCHPEPSGNKTLCEDRGCTWSPSTTDSTAPNCFYPNTWGYTQTGTVVINSDGTEKTYTLSRKDNFEFYYPGGIDNVALEVSRVSYSCIRLRYLDMSNLLNRYEVPKAITTARVGHDDSDIDAYTFSTTSQSDDLFGFDISRTEGGEVIISSKNLPGFIYSDQFLQVMLSFPNETYLYGWGERYSQVKIPTDKYTTLVAWSQDILDTEGYGNSYGVHPFLLGIQKDGNAFGVFFLNSNAMELVVTPYPALQYRTIGGIVDIFVFFGPTVQEVLEQYWNVIGYPSLPPFWSLGFHLCRWGYNTLNKTRETVEGMVEAGVPYDAQWNDIDYMDGTKDFTYDQENFAGLPDFVQELHDKYEMHYVMIVDPAISNTSGYQPYEDGLRMNAFILTSDNQVLRGQVWPGTTVFPDFFSNSTQNWWNRQLSNWRQVVDFDGIWIDMNEPSNFVNGGLNGDYDNSYENPPYFPTALLATTGSTGLKTKTIYMSAQQAYQKETTAHYNVHSLYGHSEATATYHALHSIDSMSSKRPFILSRSTYPGTGQYAAHWLGDNRSNFTDLRLAMSGIIAFNMFGIPFVGADICGFWGNTTVELCTRWMEIGSFYPFSRNHNGINYIAQDPVSLGEPVTSVSRKYLSLRYQLLPYLYTLFYRAHRYAEPVVNSLWLVDDWRMFCVENEDCMYIETQFLWGKALLFSPALSDGQRDVTALFPVFSANDTEERWFEFESGEEIPIFGRMDSKWQTFDCPLDYLPIHIRGGYIVPMQASSASNGVGQTTTQSRQKPYSIVAALGSNMNASGEIYIDDGESLDTERTGTYMYSELSVHCEPFEDDYLCVFENEVTNSGFDDISDPAIVSITIYGFGNEYLLPGTDWDDQYIVIDIYEQNYTNTVETSFDESTGVLTFTLTNSTMYINDDIYFAWLMSLHTETHGDDDDGSSSNHLSTGATVGIVIGVLMGTFIAFGITWFMFKKRKYRQKHGDYVAVDELHPL